MCNVNCCDSIQWHAKPIRSTRGQVQSPAVTAIRHWHPKAPATVGHGHDRAALQPGMRSAHAPMLISLSAVSRSAVVPGIVDRCGYLSRLDRYRH